MLKGVFASGLRTSGQETEQSGDRFRVESKGDHGVQDETEPQIIGSKNAHPQKHVQPSCASDQKHKVGQVDWVTDQIYFEFRFIWRHPEELLPEIKSSCWVFIQKLNACWMKMDMQYKEEQQTDWVPAGRRPWSNWTSMTSKETCFHQSSVFTEAEWTPRLCLQSSSTGSCHCCLCEIPSQDQWMKRRKKQTQQKVQAQIWHAEKKKNFNLGFSNQIKNDQWQHANLKYVLN